MLINGIYAAIILANEWVCSLIFAIKSYKKHIHVFIFIVIDTVLEMPQVQSQVSVYEIVTLLTHLRRAFIYEGRSINLWPDRY